MPAGAAPYLSAAQAGPNEHQPLAACRTCQATAALEQYEGPSCFAIPGNHDWIDGLETFQRHIQHRGWLGGWLLPQEASYFALRLPQGWWLFGLDLALLDDIDMCQCRCVLCLGLCSLHGAAGALRLIWACCALHTKLN